MPLLAPVTRNARFVMMSLPLVNKGGQAHLIRNHGGDQDDLASVVRPSFVVDQQGSAEPPGPNTCSTYRRGQPAAACSATDRYAEKSV